MFVIIFWCDPDLLKKYNFLAQILRALESNKMEFFIFEKFNNSIAFFIYFGPVSVSPQHAHSWVIVIKIKNMENEDK